MKKKVHKKKVRIVWKFNPVSRVVRNKKRYSRSESKRLTNNQKNGWDNA